MFTEIVCLAFKQPKNMILERINVKKIVMRCDNNHYLMHNSNPVGENVTLVCRDDATWFPNPEGYSCKGNILEVYIFVSFYSVDGWGCEY